MLHAQHAFSLLALLEPQSCKIRCVLCADTRAPETGDEGWPNEAMGPGEEPDYISDEELSEERLVAEAGSENVTTSSEAEAARSPESDSDERDSAHTGDSAGSDCRRSTFDLIHALLDKDLDAAREILQALDNTEPDMDATDGRAEWTALTAAAAAGDPGIVERIIQLGADIESINHLEETALLVATKNSHLEVVEALLLAGADVDAMDVDGDTALMVAAKLRHVELVEALVLAGAEVDFEDIDDETALLIAIGHPEGHHGSAGVLPIVKTLLAGGADPSARYPEGMTALMAVLINFNYNNAEGLATFRALVDAGADLDAQDSHGCTVLRLALGHLSAHTCGGFWQKIVYIILNAAAESTQPPRPCFIDRDDGYRALRVALARRGDAERMVRAVFAAGADVNYCPLYE